jgi:hypothetical protein
MKALRNVDCGMRNKTAMKSAFKWALLEFVVGFLLAFAVLPVYAGSISFGVGSLEFRARQIEDLSYRSPEPVTPEVERLSKFGALASYALIDYNQSVQAFYHRDGYYENNPILSKHPSRREMQTFGVVGMAILYLANKTLPEPWATIALDSVVSTEQFNIEQNRVIYYNKRREVQCMPLIITFRF